MIGRHRLWLLELAAREVERRPDKWLDYLGRRTRPEDAAARIRARAVHERALGDVEFVGPTSDTAVTMDEIVKTINEHRFAHVDEEELQRGVYFALSARFVVWREARLGKSGRVDFLVHHNIGVELKVKGTANEVMRQVASYMPHINGLVLVTTCSRHRLPPTLGGKPVAVVLVRDW